MKTKGLATLLLAAAFLVAPLAIAQDKNETDLQSLRAAVKTDKRAYVASTLDLTEAEAKKFWPVYDAYQRALDLANRQRSLAVVSLVGLDKAPSDLYARTLANELIAADELEMKSRRTMHNRVMRALPPRKAARYLQLESKIRAVAAYDIAVTIPLVK